MIYPLPSSGHDTPTIYVVVVLIPPLSSSCHDTQKSTILGQDTTGNLNLGPIMAHPLPEYFFLVSHDSFVKR